MKLFKPTTLLDRFYEIGIIIKGIDGLFELIAGVVLLTISSGTILNLTNDLTRNELTQDPHNLIATHVLHAGHQLAHGQHGFAAAFLLIHGGVKVGLVTALLLNKLWAYPVGIVVLGVLLLFQIYQLIVSPSFGMAFLSVLDVIIIWLIWREWRQVHRRQKSGDL